MACNDVAIYKYGNQIQSCESSCLLRPTAWSLSNTNRSVPNTASSRVLAGRPNYYQTTTSQRYSLTPSKRIMASRNGVDEEEQRKRERERIWRQDQLDKERFLKFGYVHGIYRDPDQEEWEKRQEYSSSSGEQVRRTLDVLIANH